MINKSLWNFKHIVVVHRWDISARRSRGGARRSWRSGLLAGGNLRLDVVFDCLHDNGLRCSLNVRRGNNRDTSASGVVLAPEYERHRPQRLSDLASCAKSQLHDIDVTSVHNHATSTTSLKSFRGLRRVVTIEPVDTLCGCGRFGIGFRIHLGRPAGRRNDSRASPPQSLRSRPCARSRNRPRLVPLRI